MSPGQAAVQAPSPIGFFERYLTVWVALCIVTGIGEKHSVACPSALIGASNFFELAVAVGTSER
jgi:arsenite transporter